MNKFAVLLTDFEHLSYPLGRDEPHDRKTFSDRKENYVLHRVESETQAEMLVCSSDWLEEHSAVPVGYVGDENNSIFVVCKAARNPAVPVASGLPEQERKDFSLAVMKRLASLHSAGFGCGGLSPEAVEFSGKQAKLSNPSALFALTESDSIFYEAVSTLRSLASNGYAKKEELESLAAAYISSSPVCRHAIVSHIFGKGAQSQPHAELAAQAKKFLAYF